jgi:peptidoglycan-associated lipoprotein
MKKLITLSTIAFSMFFLSACDGIDGPDPLDTAAGASNNGLSSSDLPGDSALGDAGLPGRGINDMAGFNPDNIKPEDIVETIYFGFDQYAVAPAEREKVKRAVDFYASNPDYKVVLVGHTDWYGTEEYNTLLSDKRCKAVQEYMLAVGTDASKIETIARGEQGSIVDVAKDSAEAKNDRRVDIVKQK